jgi:hypothetical protein
MVRVPTVPQMSKSETIKKHYPEEWETVGGLSSPSKMPCFGHSIPASACKVGGRLKMIPGSVCSNCYAEKGRYVFGNVKHALEVRLGALQRGLKDGSWARAMVTLIASPRVSASGYFRWHDAGDVQSLAHLEAIADVARQTQSVRHWLPTREARTVALYLDKYGAFPANLNVRVSLPMLNMPRPHAFDTRLTTSTAHTAAVPENTHECPAPKQDGHCGQCRACWSPDVPHVSYHKH